MTVIPIAFNPDGTVTVQHGASGISHTGTLPLAAIPHLVNPLTGQPDTGLLVLVCPEPGCGAASIHPIAGGAAPEQVQALFVLKRQATDRRKSFATVLAEVQAASDAEHPGRFRLRNVTLADIQSGRPEPPSAARDRRTKPAKPDTPKGQPDA